MEKDAALAELAFNFDSAAVSLNDRFADDEAEPGSPAGRAFGITALAVF
ncbi:MAG TPA: hypothetical protein VNN77_08345 [candidate division Zixibacteria bacterium]|nr:hypothetical protein [candidate division Zixibacteria bacterium]